MIFETPSTEELAAEVAAIGEQLAQVRERHFSAEEIAHATAAEIHRLSRESLQTPFDVDGFDAAMGDEPIDIEPVNDMPFRLPTNVPLPPFPSGQRPPPVRAHPPRLLDPILQQQIAATTQMKLRAQTMSGSGSRPEGMTSDQEEWARIKAAGSNSYVDRMR